MTTIGTPRRSLSEELLEPADLREHVAGDDWDPLHSHTAQDRFWTTTNAGEAIPGVPTPLGMTVWQRVATSSFDHAARELGILAGDDEMPADAIQPFFGRATMSVDFLSVLADRMPGASGPQVVSGLIGTVPEGMTFTPTRRYYVNVLRHFPRAFVRTPRELAEVARRQEEWWQRAVPSVAGLDEQSVRRYLDEALEHHRRSTLMQTLAVFTAIQPVHDALERVIARLGTANGSTLTAPVGGAEMHVVSDIWRASRGEISVDTVVRRHGFHGPREGEISSAVWREDARPLQMMIERYARRPDSDSPLALEEHRSQRHREAEAELLAAAPRAARPAIRGLLALGRQRLRLRGVAKRSMLQGLDGVRAGTRRLGELMAADGILDRPDDVFYLTVDELVAPAHGDMRVLVHRRRERRAVYERLELPSTFAGVPMPIRIARSEPSPLVSTVRGIGVSAGVVEGVARVVTNPDFTEVEDGEVLVAPTTDPSWSSIMFVSAALVVDIGGALSHAAVVARELEVPCVVNTRNGTQAIRTGDRLRVDGSAGTVEILQRAPQ